MFDLLSKFHLILILNIFKVAFLINLILNLPDNHGHLIGNNVLILTVGDLSGLILFDVEFYFHVPWFVFCDFVEDGFVLAEVVEAAVDLHDVFGEGRFGDEDISD